MADIKQELLARLAGVGKRRADEKLRHDTAVRELDGEEDTIKEMLRLEEKLAASAQHVMPWEHAAPLTLRPGAANLAESKILEALSNKGEWEHSEIKTYLLDRGVGVANPNFGRSIQGMLLSLRARELVQNVGIGKWRATEKALEAAS